MSESQMQPGWYYAQGDAPGTQRYWDGTQWVGGPQPVGQPQDGSVMAGLAGQPAEYGQRVIAYLIDLGLTLGIYIVGLILAAIAGAISEGLGTVVGLLAVLGYLGFIIYNSVIMQGSTGQTFGKRQQGIKLVADATGQPVGGGMAFVRILLASFLGVITCGLYAIADLLWPLFDGEKKRLTDKILNFSVVTGS